MGLKVVPSCNSCIAVTSCSLPLRKWTGKWRLYRNYTMEQLSTP